MHFPWHPINNNKAYNKPKTCFLNNISVSDGANAYWMEAQKNMVTR